MRNLLAIVMLILAWGSVIAQPGQFAGTSKKLLGNTFKESNPDKLFKTYRYEGGYLLDNSREEFEVWVSYYKKGSIRLVVMYALDTVGNKNSVLDILELKLPDTLTNLQAGSCSISGEFSEEIIATERKGKILAAWRALRDKLRFQKMSKASMEAVNCTIEGI
jgi:hypothetical protein